MYLIRTETVGKAHELIIEKILKYGEIVVTEDDEKTIELPEPSNLHVAVPISSYMTSRFNRFRDKALAEYVTALLEGTNAKFAYTYHDQLFKYDGMIDQIAAIIAKLLKYPTSRRVLAITWQPEVHAAADHPPCLQRIQCFIRGGKLLFYCEFRSNDMLSASGANMYALVHLMQYIANALGVELGWYEHTSASAHIYYDRDWDELYAYIVGLNLRQIVLDRNDELSQKLLDTERRMGISA